MEVGSDVVGFGRWGVVGVAADVAVEVVLGQLVGGDDFGEAVDVGEVAVGGDDLLFVLGAEVVLGSALVYSRSALMNSTLPRRSGGFDPLARRMRMAAGMPVP